MEGLFFGLLRNLNAEQYQVCDAEERLPEEEVEENSIS